MVQKIYETKTFLIILLIIVIAGLAIYIYQKNYAYPRIDPKTGLRLVRIYFCSDVCPDYGGEYIVFEGINNKDECARIGGKDYIDPVWGGYIGCGPSD